MDCSTLALQFIVIVLALTTLVSAENCEVYSSCKECLQDDNCVFVLEKLAGEIESKFLCTNETATSSRVTVYAKFRRQEDCSLAIDVELKGETFSNEVDDGTSETMSSLENCPIASPLLVAFYISSILLAISVSIMCTIFCWPSRDESAEASDLRVTGKRQERRRGKPEEELEDVV